MRLVVRIVVFLAVMVLLAIPTFGFQADYYLYTTLYDGYGENNGMPVLKILYNGEIVTTGLFYPAGLQAPVTYLPDRQWLISSDTAGYFETYRINYNTTSLTTSQYVPFCGDEQKIIFPNVCNWQSLPQPPV